MIAVDWCDAYFTAQMKRKVLTDFWKLRMVSQVTSQLHGTYYSPQACAST